MGSRILVLVPGSTARGGIVHYFNTLGVKVSRKVEYFVRGARNWPQRRGQIIELLRALSDLALFAVRLTTRRYDLVQTNTSLGSFGVIRDGFFIIFAKLFRTRVIVFFRGWDKACEAKIEKAFLPLFKLVYFRADCIIVLSSGFKQKLRDWQYQKPIFIETTVVDEQIVLGLKEAELTSKYDQEKAGVNILFLSRIETAKGIYELLRGFQQVQAKYSSAQLMIAGDGRELDGARTFVQEASLQNVTFLGHITGRAKQDVFRRAHIFVLPSYTEGMPNAVLEAMSCGLPVLVTPVGGLVDFFENGAHGFTLQIKDSTSVFTAIERLINDWPLMLRMSLTNYRKGQKDFVSHRVAERLDSIYDTVIGTKMEH